LPTTPLVFAATRSTVGGPPVCFPSVLRRARAPSEASHPEVSGRKLDGERLDPDHERARKDKAIADLHEMKLAILRKDYFKGEHITELVTHSFGVVRTGVLAIPSHIVARMPPDVAREAFAIATDQVNHVLTALSEGRVLEAAQQADAA
jgi:hypothetical protein